ncbi:MAG: RsmE family RNA methyltransferase [Gammaproteobacteria bacterium]|nr:RsmE family RNA methyltransferase [Gammaproteobacteria bacterium]
MSAMRVHRIFVSSPLHANAEMTINDQAAHHLINVLRQTVGDTIVVFDGSGQQADAEITALDGKRALHCRLGPLYQPSVESPLNATLFQALLRRERMDWVVQKATELAFIRSSQRPLSLQPQKYHQLVVTNVKNTGNKLQRQRVNKVSAPLSRKLKSLNHLTRACNCSMPIKPLL